MYPEEILQMDNRECLVLIRGHKPLKGLKIIPDEFSAYRQLTYARVADYIPHWRAAEEDTKEKRDAGTKASTEAIPTSQKVVDDTQMKSAQAAKSEGTAIPRIAANETIFMPEDVKEADSVFAETSVDDILND